MTTLLVALAVSGGAAALWNIEKKQGAR